ncbi:MAG: MgtC/SapB family protein [Deltaproteobacteria bacterium]|nr:MgtC/SapB family protein [Deltaproteobacteria bacterium]
MVQVCYQFIVNEGFQLFMAIFLGGLIGLEREMKGKPAGLRTTILICLGATLFMMLSAKVAMMAGSQGADPARIASGIVTGIGFLGAGSIFHGEGMVQGLTSAATIWVVGALGLAIGCGHYVLAVGVTLILLLVLSALGRLECYISDKCKTKIAEEK